MKILKSLSLMTFLCLSAAVNASTSLSLTCEGSSIQSCTKNVTESLTKIGCNLDSQETLCENFLAQDPKNPTGPGIPTKDVVCKAYAANCEKPTMGAFSDSCASDSKLVKLPKSANLHNGYWYGFFGSYSRGVCVRK